MQLCTKKQRCGEIFQAKAAVQISYIVSVGICTVYLGSSDFSEVEDTREEERNTLPNGITRSQKRRKKKITFLSKPHNGPPL